MENITQGQWLRGPSADLGVEIGQSLRFNSSGYLKRAQSSSGDGLLANDRTFTFSTWFKHGDMQETQIFGIHPSSSDNWLLGWTTSNRGFAGRDSGGYTSYNTTRQYNDPNAWYHLFLTCSSGVLTLYVNGVQGNQTDTQNHSMDRDFILGAENGNGGTPMDAYLAETYFVQGTVLHPVNDGFIRLNTDGVYVPDTPTISSYGTNGWHLTYDSSQTNGIGHDSSGQGNHFTASGFVTTAISTSNFDNDIDYKDTPTSNYAVFTKESKTGGNITDANLGFYSNGHAEWRSSPSSQLIESGKWYFEVQDNQNEIFVGVADSRYWAELYTYSAKVPGGDADNYSLGYYTNNGTKYKAGSTTANYGPSGTDGATYMVAWDADTGTIWVGKNGTWNNSATQSEIEAGTTTNAMYTGETTGKHWRAIVSHAYTTASDRAKVNFGQRPFQYTQPSGYKALQSNNYSEPTIKNGKKHFAAVTYTGNGAVRNITGLEFQPDLIFAKNTATTGHWNWHDSVRGATKRLTSNSDAAETTYNDYLKAFNSDGFQVGTEGAINGNGNEIVAYCFKAGTSYTPTVTGYTSPSASINTTAGFGIYKVTGNNTASSFTHGLNQRPQIIIAKNLTSQENWAVIGPTNDARAELAPNVYLHRFDLNDRVTKASNVLSGITDTTLSFNNYIEVGGNDDYIFYCWHSVEGFSRVGSYRGTGNDDGAFVPCGFKPAFVMIKCINQDGNWNIYDSARQPQNPTDSVLRANLTDGKSTETAQAITLLSNGFKCAGLNGNINETYYYMYMAFAEYPAVGENVPPAPAN
jgi:hypothetical protein